MHKFGKITYYKSLCDVAQVSNSSFQKSKTILLPADVDLAVDAVDFWEETQHGTECLGDVIGQR